MTDINLRELWQLNNNLWKPIVSLDIHNYLSIDLPEDGATRIQELVNSFDYVGINKIRSGYPITKKNGSDELTIYYNDGLFYLDLWYLKKEYNFRVIRQV